MLDSNLILFADVLSPTFIVLLTNKRSVVILSAVISPALILLAYTESAAKSAFETCRVCTGPTAVTVPVETPSLSLARIAI